MTALPFPDLSGSVVLAVDDPACLVRSKAAERGVPRPPGFPGRAATRAGRGDTHLPDGAVLRLQPVGLVDLEPAERSLGQRERPATRTVVVSDNRSLVDEDGRVAAVDIDRTSVVETLLRLIGV